MNTIMKQYSQQDIQKITSIKPQETVVKSPEKMEVPQIEIKEEKDFTDEQLKTALLFAQDILERSSMPFVVTHDIAEQIMFQDIPLLQAKVITLAVMKRHYTESGRGMLSGLLKEWTKEPYMDENIVTFEYKGVPVQIDIIQNKYPFFENPDVRFFRLTEFRVPNPFDEYLLWKDQVK